MLTCQCLILKCDPSSLPLFSFLLLSFFLLHLDTGPIVVACAPVAPVAAMATNIAIGHHRPLSPMLFDTSPPCYHPHRFMVKREEMGCVHDNDQRRCGEASRVYNFGGSSLQRSKAASTDLRVLVGVGVISSNGFRIFWVINSASDALQS